MLLELKNLLQQVTGAFEDLFHDLMPVTVLEPLAAAAGTDVVAAYAGKVNGLGTAKGQGRRSRRYVDRLGRVLRRSHLVGRSRVGGGRGFCP